MTSFLSASLSLFALLWAVISCLCFHNRGAKLGQQQGYEKGYREGFSAAREFAEIGVHDWWTDADEAVERTRKEMRKHNA
jgi:flagellar biosynthesis/type III secretory pathway protein FliH